MINPKYNNEELDETIRWKAYQEIKERYAKIDIDDLVIYYSEDELDNINEDNQELLVEVGILGKDKDIEVYVNLYE